RRTKAAISTGEIGGLRADARSALESVADKLALGAAAEASDDQPLREAPAIGDTVFVAGFGAEGIVRAIGGKQIEVEVRGKRMRVGLKDLRAAGGRPQAAGPSNSRATSAARSPQPAAPRGGLDTALA